MNLKTKKAFTLVELIVVITILAILWTIAFLSLQWYSADARNSKRNSDMKNIENTMVIAQSKWATLMSFVTPVAWKQLSSWSPIWWTGITVWVDYNSWIPNYTTLWIKAKDFKDPLDKDYVMWVTIRSNWKYEIASSTENWSIKTAYVVWNYTPRINIADIIVTTVTSLSWSSVIEVNSNDINKYFINDFVNGWPGTISKRIVAVYPDLKRLTLESAFSSWAYTLNLWSGTTAVPDIWWLITASWTNATIITNNQTNNLPY
jgi:prepilin-type N-terminal cleavage/methylation domain-containing protein